MEVVLECPCFVVDVLAAFLIAFRVSLVDKIQGTVWTSRGYAHSWSSPHHKWISTSSASQRSLWFCISCLQSCSATQLISFCTLDFFPKLLGHFCLTNISFPQANYFQDIVDCWKGKSSVALRVKFLLVFKRIKQEIRDHSILNGI